MSDPRPTQTTAISRREVDSKHSTIADYTPGWTLVCRNSAKTLRVDHRIIGAMIYCPLCGTEFNYDQ